jgi:outer membrane murein-binding lipoprotein Lpp
MAAAATARKAPATARPAPRRKPRRAPTSRARSGQAQAARVMRPAVAGAALLPQAAVRSVGAVRDISDSSLIMRLTRGRSWIAVLGTLLVGIVALNVVSLSLNAGSGRVSLQIDELKTQVSTLHAQIDERLSAVRVEAEAARLGLAVPDPKAITYLSANDGSAERLAHLLGTDSFLMAPSLPSSYPASGTSYAPSGTTSTATSTPTPTTTASPTPTTGTTATPTTPSSGSGSASGTSAGSGSSTGSSGSSTGGVGL